MTKQLINEAKRMQELAGITNENTNDNKSLSMFYIILYLHYII
jgi:hypothetical protein